MASIGVSISEPEPRSGFQDCTPRLWRVYQDALCRRTLSREIQGKWPAPDPDEIEASTYQCVTSGSLDCQNDTLDLYYRNRRHHQEDVEEEMLDENGEPMPQELVLRGTSTWRRRPQVEDRDQWLLCQQVERLFRQVKSVVRKDGIDGRPSAYRPGSASSCRTAIISVTKGHGWTDYRKSGSGQSGVATGTPDCPVHA